MHARAGSAVRHAHDKSGGRAAEVVETKGVFLGKVRLGSREWVLGEEQAECTCVGYAAGLPAYENELPGVS